MSHVRHISNRLLLTGWLVVYLVLTAYLAPVSHAQNCHDVTLRSQVEVDSFECPNVTGYLAISGSDITSLMPLSHLQSLEWLYITDNPVLVSLHGLEGISTIGFNLTVRGNSVLSSLSGLNGLTVVNGCLWIESNSSLLSLEGLNGITRLGDSEGWPSGLIVLGNPALVSLAGLENLEYAYLVILENNHSLVTLEALKNVKEISVSVGISGNPVLLTLTGLEGLLSLAALSIFNNANLVSLEGLEGLKSIGQVDSYGEGLDIIGNESLKTLKGLDNLTTVFDGLRIENNKSLQSLEGLEGLKTIGQVDYFGEGLYITGNESLKTLKGLDNLTTVYNGGAIADNDSLVSLHGLEKLAYLDGMDLPFGGYDPDKLGFSISGNPSLATMEGLYGLQYVKYLDVVNNEKLTSLAGLERLSSVDGLTISGNATLHSLEGLAGLTVIGEHSSYYSGLSIQHNPRLTSLHGLDHLTRIQSSPMIGLDISHNEALIDLTGLEQLSSVVNRLVIAENASLVSLEGLDNLGMVYSWGYYNSGIFIVNNSALISVDNLRGITQSSFGYSGVIEIAGNSNLTSCSCGLSGLIQNGVLVVDPDDVHLYNNAPEAQGGTCNSVPEVLAAPCSSNTDLSPAVCGDLRQIRQEGKTVAIELDPSDPESGIRQVFFQQLTNASARIDSTSDSYLEGQTYSFSEPYPEGTALRVDKQNLTQRATVVIEVTNGAGLTALCDPVLETLGSEIPTSYTLDQNVPNPFNPTSAIRFALPESRHVRLVVYDVTGREVTRLVDHSLEAGAYTVTFDGKSLPSGLYFYRIMAGSFTQTRTMSLVK